MINKQIGWSVEENLLWEVLYQLNKLSGRITVVDGECVKPKASRVSRQIGWSNEANLLWQIVRELEKMNCAVGATPPAS
jgi:hypothetical protein